MKFYDHYLSHKKKAFESALANAHLSERKFIIYNSENIKLGEISEADVLSAKYETDLCFNTKIKQLLNYIWVLFYNITKLFIVLPYILVMVLILSLMVIPSEQLVSITLGELLVFIVNNWLPIQKLLSICLIIQLAIYPMMGKPPLGYKDFYGIKLKGILAKQVPNIANANGYSLILKAPMQSDTFETF